MRRALIVAGLAATAAFASVTTTEAPPVYEVHLPDGSIEKGKPWPKTELECKERARAYIPKGSCVVRFNFTSTTTCADERAPHIMLTRNVDDPKMWDEPPAKAVQPDPTDDTKWVTVQWLYVHNPSWPGGYPNCWIRGDADPWEWCVNGANADAVFMQRKDEPGACPELPNTIEPVNWPGPTTP